MNRKILCPRLLVRTCYCAHAKTIRSWRQSPVTAPAALPNTQRENTDSTRDEEKQLGTAEKLLRDSNTFLDLQIPGTDQWSTSPYPGVQVRDKVEEPKVDPAMTSILLFPGQGSQFVGMGKKLLSFPNVQSLYDRASEVLGYDLLKVCLEGPKNMLDRTIRCQPAVFVTSLAAVERLRAESPTAIDSCVACAGFSVGEYVALVFAGSISFEKGLELVKLRAELMQEASEKCASGMLTVFVRADSQLGRAMQAAKQYAKKEHGIAHAVCQVANYLCTECRVVAGDKYALQFLQDHSAEFKLGAMKRIATSGAFHTPLMLQAALEFKQALFNTQFKPPLICVAKNLDGKMYGQESKSIAHSLYKQVYNAVRWEQIMHNFYDRKDGEGFPRTYEVGPGKQLTALLKRTNVKAWNNCAVVET